MTMEMEVLWEDIRSWRGETVRRVVSASHLYQVEVRDI
jgi:hypothetical protein